MNCWGVCQARADGLTLAAESLTNTNLGRLTLLCQNQIRSPAGRPDAPKTTQPVSPAPLARLLSPKRCGCGPIWPDNSSMAANKS